MAAASFNTAIFGAGGLLVVSVLLTKLSGRAGIPGLLLFILVGMLAGSEGPGGIPFDDFQLAHDVGVVSLILILFSGGLDTEWSRIKPILMPGLSLATVGVLVTAGTVAAAAHYLLELSLPLSLLLGAVVSSTDAAAIFGLLRSRGLKLRGHSTALLEFESGSNDPMAVFLTIGITALIVDASAEWSTLVSNFIRQFLLGALGGILMGRLGQILFNKLRLDFDGLYPVMSIGLAILTFGATELVGGNGYLAVYVAGLTLGSRSFMHRITLIHFHDALAWLMQIIMFLCLGLLVFPSQLLAQTWPGIVLALILMFLARPLAVFISLAPFGFSRAEKALLSWFGLRGAVPIILATIPIISRVQGAEIIFNQIFFVVLLSVLIQGMSVTELAKRLGLLLDHSDEVRERRIASQTLEVVIPTNSPVVGKRIVELNLPEHIFIVLITRNGEGMSPRGGTIILAGDRLLISEHGVDPGHVKDFFISGTQILA